MKENNTPSLINATSYSQSHAFDIGLACEFGVELAVLIHHFQHWIRINQHCKRNLKDGSCWTYQSRKEIQAHFPYWSIDEVRRLTDKLIDLGILKRGNYNKRVMNTTLWYAFVDEKRFGVDYETIKNMFANGKIAKWDGKTASPSGKSAKPLYNKDTDTIPTDTIPKEREKLSPPLPSLEAFGDHVKFKVGDYTSLCEKHGKEVIDYYIGKMNHHVSNNRAGKAYLNARRTLEDVFIAGDKVSGSGPFSKKLSPAYPKSEGRVDNTSAAANQTLASSIYKATKAALKWETSKRIYTDTSEITFDMGSSREVIKYTENAFRERCLTWLRKMGLPLEGL